MILAQNQVRMMMTRNIQINAKQVVATPVRSVHARGYNDFYDMPYHIFHEINAAMQSCHNCDDYAFVFEKYSAYLTDFQIGYAFEDIALTQLDRVESFWKIILPRVKEQVPTLDRQCTQSLL